MGSEFGKRTRMISRLKYRLAVSVGLTVLLAIGTTIIARSSGEPSSELSSAAILKKIHETYASLTSYSDEGKIVYTPPGLVTTSIFHIKLARPNLYRIDLVDRIDNSQSLSNVIPPTKDTVAWSVGKGYFFEWEGKVRNELSEGLEKSLQKLGDEKRIKMSLEIALESVAPKDVPSVFFDLDKANDLIDQSTSSVKRQVDEKAGDIDCYVISGESNLGPRTLWIGKQDFLIHQIKTVIVENVDMAKSENAAQSEIATHIPNFPKRLKIEPGDVRSIEIEMHTNIMVNQKFLPVDFAR